MTEQAPKGFFFPEFELLTEEAQCEYKEKALKRLTQAAEQGSAEGQFRLAYCYEFGDGVAQDDKLAFDNYLLAALQGHLSAQNRVGFYYRYGRGVDVNEKNALKWFQLATEGVYKNARKNLESEVKKEGVISASKDGEKIAKLEASVGGKMEFDPGFHAEQERAKKAKVSVIERSEYLDRCAPMNSSDTGM